MNTAVNFQCWKCEEEFSFAIDPDSKPQLLLSCPYCGAACFVDFEPYRKSSMTVTRGGGESEQSAFALPGVVMLREAGK